MCNQLYFAVAPNVCDVKEIPEECGMVLYSPNTGCIRTIKKAPFRNIDPPVEMFKYLMFTYIGPYFRQDSKYPRHERLLESEAYEMAKKYIEDKVTFREVGREFSGKLRRYITEIERKAQDVEYFEERAEKAEKRFDAICRELGVTGYYNKFDNCLEAIKHMKNGSVSPDIKRCVQEIKRSSDLLAQLLEDTAAGRTVL